MTASSGVAINIECTFSGTTEAHMTTAMALAISTDVGVAFAVCGVGGGGEKEAGEVIAV